MMFNGIAYGIAQQEAQRRAEEAAYGEIGAYAREANGKSPPGLANAVASIGAVCARNGGGCNYNTTGPGSSGWNRQAWSNIVAAKGGLNESGGGNLMCVNTTSCVYVNYARTYQNGLRVWARRPTPLKLTGAVVIPNTAAGTLKLYFFHMPYHGWLNTSDYLNGPH